MMKKILIVVVLVAVGGFAYVMYQREQQEDVSEQNNGVAANTYDECVALGNPVMESYPQQCIDAVGNHFTQYIGNGFEKQDLIRLTSPQPTAVVESPLTITGEARGYWFFEASFPVVITDWDGRIIAEHFAQAQGDWMTEEFVPFTAEINFESPYSEGDPDFMRNGTLILQKDNPSGLPENDDALEIPIIFN